MTRFEAKLLNVLESAQMHALNHVDDITECALALEDASHVAASWLRAHRGSNGTRRLRRKYGRRAGRPTPGCYVECCGKQGIDRKAGRRR